MFAESSFTMKSGPMGTAMFSRSGKCTNYQYVCFSNGHDQEDNSAQDQAEEMQILND
jgi:hypothetical protein